jgi:signal transduction histidine kinase
MPHQPMPRTPPGGEPAEELLAILAHELRRPLTALLGALATLQQHRHALSARQQQELLGIAHRQVEQLERLLDQLLAAADLDRGQGRLVRRSLVDAAALAEEAGRAARLAHPHHRITIAVAGPLLVRADPLAVCRILGNLLDNAATYAASGTAIRLSAHRDGVHAVLAVQDDGPGIPAADRERIFERYARLDRRIGAAGVGFGLGLYVARRLASANRGKLHLTDPPGGRGARFELRLHLAPPASDPTPETASGTASREP